MIQLNKKTWFYIAGAVAALVVIALIARSVTIAREQKEREDIIKNSEILSSGGLANSSGAGAGVFVPTSYTDRLNSDFESYSADTALYDELIQLDDNKIRAIWTDWDSRYKSQKGKTLGLALYDAYWFTRAFTLSWDWTYHAKKFYDKLKSIGLS